MGKYGENQLGWGGGGYILVRFIHPPRCVCIYPGPSQDLCTQLAVTTALQFR